LVRYAKYVVPDLALLGIGTHRIIRKKVENKKSFKWLNHVRKETPKSGKFIASDKTGTEVLFEWVKTDANSPDFSLTMKSIADITGESFAPVEVKFLRAHPDLVFKEMYYKPFEPLFKDGVENVDWKCVEEKMKSYIKSFHEIDASKISADDLYFFVKAKNKENGVLLGIIIYFLNPYYRYGDVKVINIAVKTEARNRGLGKLLMSSIFNIVPEIKRMFLTTRVTNDIAINAYRRWGFTKDLNPIQQPHAFNLDHWIALQYNPQACDVLQKVAAKLKKESE